MRKLIVKDVLWSYLMFGHLSNYLASNSNQTNLLTYFTQITHQILTFLNPFLTYASLNN